MAVSPVGIAVSRAEGPGVLAGLEDMGSPVDMGSLEGREDNLICNGCDMNCVLCHSFFMSL